MDMLGNFGSILPKSKIDFELKGKWISLDILEIQLEPKDISSVS